MLMKILDLTAYSYDNGSRGTTGANVSKYQGDDGREPLKPNSG